MIGEFTIQVELIRDGDPDSSRYGAGTIREKWTNANGDKHREIWPAVVIRDANTGDTIAEEWWRHGKLHREDAPARTFPTKLGLEQEWYWDGELHREGGPAVQVVLQTDHSETMHEEWRLNGELHRDGGPARLSVSENTGHVIHETWAQNGMLHREDGPAKIDRDEATNVPFAESWLLHGRLHRENGPAEIERDPLTGNVLEERFFQHGEERLRPNSSPGVALD